MDDVNDTRVIDRDNTDVLSENWDDKVQPP